jgi:hypothetical protein
MHSNKIFSTANASILLVVVVAASEPVAVVVVVNVFSCCGPY